MYGLPKPGYDLGTMRAVALAYRPMHQAGHVDQSARETATAAFRARHPEIERPQASEAATALLPVNVAFFNSRRDQLTALMAPQAIPTIFDTRIYVEAGGLASHGPNYAIAHREAGAYAGRILHGAKPADLPVVELSNIGPVINLKTARALGMAVPQSLLGRVDEVIEYGVMSPFGTPRKRRSTPAKSGHWARADLAHTFPDSRP